MRPGGGRVAVNVRRLDREVLRMPGVFRGLRRRHPSLPGPERHHGKQPGFYFNVAVNKRGCGVLGWHRRGWLCAPLRSQVTSAGQME